MLLIENGSKIYAADTITGAYALAALLPDRIEALAATPDGQLYGFNDGLLVTIDLATETTMAVARSDDPAARSVGALAIDETGRAFAAVTGVFSGVYRVDLATADFALIPGTETLFVSALTELDGVLFAASERALVALDPASGAILSQTDLLVEGIVGALAGVDGRLFAYTLDQVLELNPITGRGTTAVDDVGDLVVNDRVLSFVAGDATILPGATGAGLSEADAREVAFLYEAGLDRNGAIDRAGLNFWIDQREAGLTSRDLATAFLGSAEFAAANGEPDTLSDRALVGQLYRNVLDREGDAEGIDFWTGVVARNSFDRADLLLAFAASPENVAGSPDVETLSELAPGVWDFLG